MRRSILLSVMLFILITTTAGATTRVVFPDGSGPYPTIQSAIDASVDDDIIELADGTFSGTGNGGAMINGKRLTIRSQSNDPATCTVLSTAGWVIGFAYAGADGSVLEGITLTGPNEGLHCTTAAPRYANLIVEGCRTGCYVRGGSNPRFENCIFRNNTIYGMHINFASATISHCQVENNHTTGSAGGILFNSSTGLVEYCDIVDNTNNLGGGGITIKDGSDVDIEYCTISGNNSPGKYGGGVYVADATASLLGCEVSNNSAAKGAGIMDVVNSQLTMIDCSVFGNTGTSVGGGIEVGNSAYLNAVNVDFHGNTCPTGADGYIDNGAVGDFTCCDLDPAYWYVGTTSGVMNIYSDGCVVPDEATSWGEVKAIFR